VRQAAAGALGQQTPPAALPALAARLGDTPGQPAVALALARYGLLARPLLDTALRQGTTEESRWAARALGASRLAEALPLLQAALDDGRTPVRAAAARALGELGRPDAASSLLDSLRLDPEPSVRHAAAVALGQLGIAEAIPVLRAGLAEPYAEIRNACRQALIQLAAPPSEELLEIAEEVAAGRWARLEQRGEAARELLEVALQSAGLDAESAARRVGAAQTLGRLQPKGSFAALAARLQDPHPRVRSAAATALGEIGDLRAEAPLVTCYGSVQPEVRIACLQAMAVLAGPIGERLLIAALDDPAPEVATAAFGLVGLRQLGGAFPRLVEILGEHDVDRQLQAMDALAALGQLAAVEPLLELLQDQRAEVRRHAAAAMGRLGWQPVGWRNRREDAAYAYFTGPASWEIPGEPDADQVRRLLTALSQSEDPARRRVAAEALGGLTDPRGRAGLRQALEQETDRDCRIVVAEALERLGDSPAEDHRWLPYWTTRGRWDVLVQFGAAALPELLLVLDEPQAARRHGAIEALVQLGAAGDAGLLQASRDPEPPLRIKAIRALAARPTPELGERLIALLDDEAVAATARELLQEGFLESARPRLLEVLATGTPRQRAETARLLGQSRDNDLVPALVARLTDEEPTVRLAAIAALGAPGRTAALPPLQELVRQASEPTVRATAAAALGRIGDPIAEETLLGGLGDAWGEVRRACREALTALGRPPSAEHLLASERIAVEAWGRVAEVGQAAVPLLLHLTTDPGDDPTAAAWRAGAAEALGRIGDPRARPALERLLQDPYPRVRLAAAEAQQRLDTPPAAPPPTAEAAPAAPALSDTTAASPAETAPSPPKPVKADPLVARLARIQATALGDPEKKN